MALTGNALLAIWHDVEPSAWHDFMEWHTREHMPERLSVPGFTMGKRTVNRDLERHRIGTIYCGEDLEVFRSPAYMERLNDPTEWTSEVAPSFRNFLRVSCVRLASAGIGDGGAVATVRLNFIDADGEEKLRAGARRLAEGLLIIRGVACAHVALARSEVSSVRTRETEIRPQMSEAGFDALLIVEGSERASLDEALPAVEAVIAACACGVGEPVSLVHDLAFQLRREQV